MTQNELEYKLKGYNFSDNEIALILRAVKLSGYLSKDEILKALESQEVDVEATRKHMESKGATEDEILSMEIEADDIEDVIDGVRKALGLEE